MKGTDEGRSKGGKNSGIYRNKLKKEKINNYNENPKKCLACGKSLPYEKRNNKYCDHSCSARINNLGVDRYKLKTSSYKNKDLLYCLYCKTLLKGKRYKYCNSICQQNHAYETYIENWKNEKETGLSGETQTSRHIRRYLFIKYNNKCSKCSWSEINTITRKIPLQINHIDGNFKNNKEENLELLCPNCHSLTPTFGSLNKGNGRRYFREWKNKNKIENIL